MLKLSACTLRGGWWRLKWRQLLCRGREHRVRSDHTTLLINKPPFPHRFAFFILLYLALTVTSTSDHVLASRFLASSLSVEPFLLTTASPPQPPPYSIHLHLRSSRHVNRRRDARRRAQAPDRDGRLGPVSSALWIVPASSPSTLIRQGHHPPPLPSLSLYPTRLPPPSTSLWRPRPRLRPCPRPAHRLTPASRACSASASKRAASTTTSRTSRRRRRARLARRASRSLLPTLRPRLSVSAPAWRTARRTSCCASTGLGRRGGGAGPGIVQQPFRQRSLGLL